MAPDQAHEPFFSMTMPVTRQMIFLGLFRPTISPNAGVVGY